MRLTSSLAFLIASVFLQSSLGADEILRTAGDRPIDIEHIKLDIEVFLKEKRIAGTASLDFTCLRDLQTVRLDAVGHEVTQVHWIVADGNDFPAGGATVDFENTEQELRIHLGKQTPRGSGHRLVISYQVREPEAGLYFFGPSNVDPKVPLTVWSQGEPVSNRHWIPCLDQPNERQTTELIATVPTGMEVLSNGVLAERKKLDGDKVPKVMVGFGGCWPIPGCSCGAYSR